MSVQHSAIQFIPLNKLTASPRNVRRKDRKCDLEALAASIAACGLLQNLCVAPAGDDRFEVDAGGRRHLALKLLARSGVIAKDFPVPCHVVTPEDGREVSLVENVHRVAMDAMDEVEAFAALAADGATREDIARRFGVTLRHVEQRLALASLSPKIKAGWKRGDVTLEAARAFCLVDDHAQQDAVFRSLSKPVTHPHAVRARLMDGRMRATDRLATFVGIEAYEQAGGRVVRDLFDPEAVFIETPALLTKLAEDKLDALRGEWLAQGWSWVDLDLGEGSSAGLSRTRLRPEWRDPTPEEQAELDRLTAEIETLDSELESNSEEDDRRWAQRDTLEAAYETIRQAGRCWSSEVKAIAGVMLAIDHEGVVVATEGLVRAEDQKAADAFLKLRRSEAGGEPTNGPLDAQPPKRTSALPRALNRDLTLARTQAIRAMLAGDPDVALAVCVATLAAKTLSPIDMTGIGLWAQLGRVDDRHGLADQRADLAAQLPASDIDILTWALDLSRERLLAMLAVLVASTVDLVHEDTSDLDLRKQAIADRLAQHLDVDMTRFWSPGLDYWVRLPKATLLAALSEAPGMAGRTARAREDMLKAHARLRKDELAAKLANLFENSGYLPDILVQPLAAGRLDLTREGRAIISEPAIAAQ